MGPNMDMDMNMWRKYMPLSLVLEIREYYIKDKVSNTDNQNLLFGKCLVQIWKQPERNISKFEKDLGGLLDITKFKLWSLRNVL